MTFKGEVAKLLFYACRLFPIKKIKLLLTIMQVRDLVIMVNILH